MIRRSSLKKQGFVLATASAAILLTAVESQAETFRYASQGTINQLDPYSLNETTTLAFLGNIYEGLIMRDENLQFQPALAEKWELIEPNRWRFYLRKGVKFHNGNDFNADDVIFSLDRVRKEGSDLRTYVPADMVIEKVDDYTLDFVTPAPNPILFYQWEGLYIMDKEWAEANGAVDPSPAAGDKNNFAVFNANGTGPFILKSHEPGVRSELVANPNWWGTPTHNVTTAIFTPIAADGTRVAALLSGEVDMIFPVPVQDIDRVDGSRGTKVLKGPEQRVIFLGMDQARDELLHSNIKGKNPLQDVRVRKAFYQAIDTDAIQQRVMRGLAEPSPLMIVPELFPSASEFARLPYDPEASKKLLAEAGYPDGFEITLDCPNDRYVNDEAICQAVTAMLTRVGIKTTLNAQPKAQFFGQILAPNYDTSFYLLGWSPGSYDYHNVLSNLHGCPSADGKRPPANAGGYCNPKVDELAKQILSESDPVKRNNLAIEAFKMTTDDVAYIPLHKQMILWGLRDNVEIHQRPDDWVALRFVTMK